MKHLLHWSQSIKKISLLIQILQKQFFNFIQFMANKLFRIDANTMSA